ncbi:MULTISPECIES: hypothetical protein [unclassified Mesorhizobium]|uniref:hypothetical protein n=1 Tax=unclassified Mesorhizobium TaxID=325217 RepID=UPI0011295F49|nr:MULTISPECIES: hypothetical protein [unclassified Mesorhizobium]TPK42624.1 hypothetical protein FJ550_29660 [Mesorhizobium sp. B2-5-2]TPL26744.1 hypothetical protein FJ946_12980 [Mesorhizobium sp. B2-4-7]TPL40522.1 hypothetical protein FJ961_17280 [Mesorhizobium sp. B2-4-5]TPM76796.1 hypothetical protein FJ968_03510 [Mesorhizobium sp. B2-1-6]TPN72459.1 hypothetical protein FJ985_29165 [Mesorhizobium sp. B1-1-2]
MIPKAMPAEVTAFDPAAGYVHPARSTGIRRITSEKAACTSLRWPTTAKERFELFDAWHDVAMQIVHAVGGSFRFLAVTKKVIHWQSGTICLSNADLAARAGRCAEKTITRDVAQAEALGIVIVEMGWRKDGTQIFRTRNIRPSIPQELSPGIVLPDGGFDLDNSGPDRSGVDLDNSGPGDRDISGPNTIETIRGGNADAA